MRFPEWLYALLPGDQGTQQLGVVWREGTGTQSAVTVSVDVYVVPTDKCLVLTNATLRSASGAATVCTRKRLMADPPAGNTRYNIIDDETNSATFDFSTTNWQGEVVVPGGWKVKAEGTFDAGTSPNEINGEIHGYLIPRGSFVFG